MLNIYASIIIYSRQKKIKKNTEMQVTKSCHLLLRPETYEFLTPPISNPNTLLKSELETSLIVVLKKFAVIFPG